MAKCDYCGKTPMHGNSRSHSMRATKRQYKPNIQKIQVLEEGRLVSRFVCTRCMKTMTKDEKI